MDRVNRQTAHQHPELAELRHCKNEGMKIGLLVLVFVGSTSYLGLRVAPVRHTLSSLQIHARYHPLMAGGVALVSSYIAAALTTRRCIDQRKRNRQLLSRKTRNRGSL